MYAIKAEFPTAPESSWTGLPVAGHAAASWEDKQHATVCLDLVHIRPGVPPEVRDALVRLAVCEAAEAGALHVVTHREQNSTA